MWDFSDRIRKSGCDLFRCLHRRESSISRNSSDRRATVADGTANESVLLEITEASGIVWRTGGPSTSKRKLPEEKMDRIRKLMVRDHTVIMIGDGIDGGDPRPDAG